MSHGSLEGIVEEFVIHILNVESVASFRHDGLKLVPANRCG